MKLVEKTVVCMWGLLEECGPWLTDSYVPPFCRVRQSTGEDEHDTPADRAKGERERERNSHII